MRRESCRPRAARPRRIFASASSGYRRGFLCRAVPPVSKAAPARPKTVPASCRNWIATTLRCRRSPVRARPDSTTRRSARSAGASALRLCASPPTCRRAASDRGSSPCARPDRRCQGTGLWSAARTILALAIAAIEGRGDLSKFFAKLRVFRGGHCERKLEQQKFAFQIGRQIQRFEASSLRSRVRWCARLPSRPRWQPAARCRR